MSDKTRVIDALIFTDDDDLLVVSIEPTLENLQGAVGGFIESVSNGPGWTMYVNEDGVALGLDVNTNATKVAVGLGWLGGRILGPAVLLGGPDEDGNDTSIPVPVTVQAVLTLTNATNTVVDFVAEESTS